MVSPDLSQSFNSAKSKISAIKTYTDVSKSSKDLQKSAGDSSSQSTSKLASQLSQISEKQKRFQRNVPTSTDQLLSLIGETKGSGSETMKYLRRKILEVAAKTEPEVSQIFISESFKAVGCSQEQTYIGTDPLQLSINPLPLLPQSEGIYIPVQSVDFFSNLKNSPESEVGKVYYELPKPSVDVKFIPYGGSEFYPMNKLLYDLMSSDNVGRSFATIFGKNFQGKSLQNLFDIQYTKTNEFGVNGDFFRVIMIDREGKNDVGTFLVDYFQTIKLFDAVDIGAQLTNLLSNAIDIKAQVGFGELNNKSKFFLILQRILGLCFDSRREIDVSGTAKVAELDGIDDSFYELNEVDLRTIDEQISNIQTGVMEFIDCDNVKLPVDYNLLVQELVSFRETSSGKTEDERVDEIEKIIDSIYQNPEWNILVPTNFNVQIAINQDVIKKIPLVVAASVLTPKALLPIFILLSIVKNKVSATYNQQVGPINDNLLLLDNVVTDGVDFLKKFKSFAIELVSKINEIFLRTLFEELKKDIVNLISLVLTDISNSKISKKYSMILKLANIALVVAEGISDYRKCKSLVDEILLLLNLLGSTLGIREIPLPLLLLSSLLPGSSPERASINVIELLQSYGIPTGTLPDGSPNLMALYNLATTKGIDKEMSDNGKVEIVIDPRLPIAGVGKFI
jgi:hypothetical protein